MATTSMIDPAPEMVAPADRPAAVPLRKRVRQLGRQLGPWPMVAMILFLAVAVLIARLSWQLPLINAAECARDRDGAPCRAGQAHRHDHL
jgi:adenylate cyclase